MSVLVLFLLVSCDNGPKVISTPVSEVNTPKAKTGVFSNTVDSVSHTPTPGGSREGVHTVRVKEVLPTSKYVYLNVEENGETFWIATNKQPVEVGQTYYYKDGLLKTNFESKEYNRTFDKLYLVGKIVAANHGQNAAATGLSKVGKKSGAPAPKSVIVEGSIPIADLVSNPQKYEGKMIQISGRCTKLNANIMGRNWMHLQDGSKDDYDLVITSDVAIPEGHVITMKGKVVLNKDFGAGYKYDIILEEGTVVK